ncbi:MAG: lipid-A-disaccharide synthase N-terminal domain-containing protein [Verrucomicrobiota bacterium]|nr:lipid-A-disaccharide synthase N-terminal domain-containing protein [Verrucomicrobiota bacterium]
MKGMQLPDLAAFGIPTITMTPWKIVGLTGSFIFGIRFIIQWLASERAKKSVIPFGFWECSAIGCILTLSYFIFSPKQDVVGIVQNLLPLPIYLRNLYFRYSERKPKHPGNEPRPAE